MADDILITVGANVKGVVTAIDKTTRLENSVKKLQKALDAGRISNTQFDAAINKASKSAKGYEKAVLDYSKALKLANQAQKEAAAADQKAKQEAKAFAQARKEATDANRAFDAQRKRDIAAAKEQSAEEERLRRKFIEGHAAMELYSKELNDLAVARKAGIITAEQQRQGLERLNQQMASGTGVFSAYGKTMQEATTRNNRLGVVTQQAGYQIGDFLVQVQSGTNPMVAFGQQATQLAGVMTMFGGKMLVIGSVLGVAIPLLTAVGAAFLRSRQEAAKAAEDVNTLDDELKSLDRTLQDWVRSKRAAEAGITIEELLGGEGLKDAEKNLRSAREELKRLRDEVTGEGRFETTGIGLAINYAQTLMASKELDAAAAAYVSAVQRLEQLRQKQAEEQYKTFAEEAIQLKQQLKMQETIAQFGEDSDEAKILALQQQVDSYNRAIKEQVRSGELTKEQGEELIRLNTSLVEGEALLKLMADHAYNLGDNLKFAADIAPKVQERAVRIGVASGAIPPEALKDLPQTAGEKAMEDILNRRRSDAKKEASKTPKSGGKSEAEQLAERIANFEQQLQLEEALIGKSEERKRIIQALGVEFVNQNAAAVAKYEADIARITELNRLEEQRKSIMASVESSMESGFMAMVDGTKSVKDAFKDMAREIIKELYRVLVVKRMVGAISGGMGSLGSLFSGPAPGSTASILGTVNANGNAFFGGRLTPFANGGIVGGPTMFPMAGGKTGLMGEAGPEAIMPLKRDKNGRLGVSVDGGSGSVVVNNNINVTGGSDPAAIRMEVAKLMPQITNATKAAVIDARRRGGQMKASFG